MTIQSSTILNKAPPDLIAIDIEPEGVGVAAVVEEQQAREEGAAGLPAR